MTNKFIRFRKRMKISQSKLAEVIGVGQATFGKKENGVTEFTLSEAYKLANFLGITIEQLYNMLTDWSDDNESKRAI